MICSLSGHEEDVDSRKCTVRKFALEKPRVWLPGIFNVRNKWLKTGAPKELEEVT